MLAQTMTFAKPEPDTLLNNQPPKSSTRIYEYHASQDIRNGEDSSNLAR